MKNSFDSGRKKRKYALAAALFGALVLPLCSCIGGIEEKAQQYLSSQYSGKFTIINAEHEPDSVGPIPLFRSSFHLVVSDRFPAERDWGRGLCTNPSPAMLSVTVPPSCRVVSVNGVLLVEIVGLVFLCNHRE